MDKSFIEKIEQMARPELVGVHGRQYSTSKLVLVPKEARPIPLTVHTLAGLVQYLKSNRDELELAAEIMVHVSSPGAVQVLESCDRDDGGRTVYLNATPGVREFVFNEWHDSEQFLINLMALFVDTVDCLAVLRIVGNLRSEAVKQLTDDGMTQHVVAKTGIAAVGNVEIPRTVLLSPYRTFQEVAQPASHFVFRVRDSDAGRPPQCALFEADGGFWRLEAMQTIRFFLEKELEGMNIPIIA